MIGKEAGSMHKDISWQRGIHECHMKDKVAILPGDRSFTALTTCASKH